jgi:hypothetical protein
MTHHAYLRQSPDFPHGAELVVWDDEAGTGQTLVRVPLTPALCLYLASEAIRLAQKPTYAQVQAASLAGQPFDLKEWVA